MFPHTRISQIIAVCNAPSLRFTLERNPAYSDLLFGLFRSNKARCAFVLHSLARIDPADIDAPLIARFGEAPRNAMSWIADFDPILMPLAVMAGADVNQHCSRTGLTPLCVAIQKRDVDLARRLLRLGASPTLGPDPCAGAALPIQRANGDAAMVSLLLAAGATAQ